MFVKDVMNTNCPILREEDTILAASKYMKDEKVRNLPVVDRENKLVGLLTLREIIETMFREPSKILIKDSMIKFVATATPEDKLEDAIKLMLENQYGCLPVIDKDKSYFGVVSEADLLKTLYKLEITK